LHDSAQRLTQQAGRFAEKRDKFFNFGILKMFFYQ